MASISLAGFELMTVAGDNITADLIIWRRYRCRTHGMVEAFLDLNPHLARIHRVSPFIPPGTQVRIPIDYNALKRQPKPVDRSAVWGEAKGYTL